MANESKRLIWDEEGKKTYETGVSNGVLYVMGADGKYGDGVAWNGLTKVTESPSGAEATPIYADNQKYLNLMSKEEFGASVEAYTYPEEYTECDGSKEIAPGVYAGQQARKTFGLAYTTIVGNDTAGEDYGKKIHLIYGAKAAPSQKDYGTQNESPEAITFSWELKTTPVNVNIEGVKPMASLVIDSTKTTAEKLKKIEDILYGTETESPRLPLPDEVVEILKAEDAGGEPVSPVEP